MSPLTYTLTFLSVSNSIGLISVYHQIHKRHPISSPIQCGEFISILFVIFLKRIVIVSYGHHHHLCISISIFLSKNIMICILILIPFEDYITYLHGLVLGFEFYMLFYSAPFNLALSSSNLVRKSSMGCEISSFISDMFS